MLSRPVRIGIITLASLLVLAVMLAVIAGISILRSDWFFQQVRQAVVTQLEKATGGKVELREFHFNWTTLVAEADGLVIHGTELPPEAPLFRAEKVVIGLKLISLATRQVDVASVDLIAPQANLILSADGRTNIPEPKTPSSNKPTDQAILDLAIGRFGVQNGTVQVKSAGQPPKDFPLER